MRRRRGQGQCETCEFPTHRKWQRKTTRGPPLCLLCISDHNTIKKKHAKTVQGKHPKERFEWTSPTSSDYPDVQEDPESEINGGEFSPVITRPTRKSTFSLYKPMHAGPMLVGGKNLGEEEEESGAV